MLPPARRAFPCRAHAGRGLHRPARDRGEQPHGSRRARARRAAGGGHLLSAAASWGETLGARAIFVGAVWEDSSGYPDCRPEFYRAFEEAIRQGTRPETDLRIVTPVIAMTKAEIVRRGRQLDAPFELTWSCYQAEDEACGACESCLLRLKGFAEAGVEDPIPYRPRR